MNEHTKGEWTIEPVGVAGNPNHKMIMGHPNPDDFQVIRTIGCLFDHGTTEENEANAHLIAAAPSMRTMLESNIVYFRNLRRVWEDYDDSKTAREMLSILDDIIKQNEDVLAGAKKV